MEEFKKFIKAIVGIDDINMQLVLSKYKERKVVKGKSILRKGQIATQYFYIISGGIIFYGGYKHENTCLG